MSDTKVVNAGENTPEHVAYKLMQDVMHAERMGVYERGETKRADRKYLLDTYADCLHAVRGYRQA